MYKIDDPSAIASRPAPGALGTEGWFKRGVAGGAQGTVVTAEHKNMVQAEMEAIRALNPTDPGSDKTDDGQLAAAILARIGVQLSPACSGFHTVWDDQDKITTGPGRCTSDISASFIDVVGSEQKDVTVAWSQGGVGGAPSGLPALAIGQRLPFFVGWNDDASPLVTHGWDIEANAETAALLVADTGYAHWKRIGWHKIERDNLGVLSNIQRYFQDPADPTRWIWNLEEGAGAGKSLFYGIVFETLIDGTLEPLIANKAYQKLIAWCPPNCVADMIVGLSLSNAIAESQFVQVNVADIRMWPVPDTSYGGQFWEPVFSVQGHSVTLSGQTHHHSMWMPHGPAPEILVSSNYATGSADIGIDIFTRGWIDTRGVNK